GAHSAAVADRAVARAHPGRDRRGHVVRVARVPRRHPHVRQAADVSGDRPLGANVLIRAAAVVVAVVAASACAPPTRVGADVPKKPGPEVAVSPRSGPPGTVFTYTGRGFTGGLGAISHLVRADGIEAYQAKRFPVAADGRFERPIDSADFPPGTYTV